MSIRRRSLLGGLFSLPFLGLGKASQAVPPTSKPKFPFEANHVLIPSPLNPSPLVVSNTSAAQPTVTIKAAVGQTAPLMQWTDSTNTVIAYLSPDGVLHAKGFKSI